MCNNARSVPPPEAHSGIAATPTAIVCGRDREDAGEADADAKSAAKNVKAAIDFIMKIKDISMEDRS